VDYQTRQTRRVLPLRLRQFVLFVALSCLVASAGAVAQEDDSVARPDTEGSPVGIFSESVEVRVINVEVIVTDRAGQPVGGLPREEFELVVDGKVTPITNYYAEVGGVARESVDAIQRPSDSTFVTEEEVAVDPAKRNYVVILIDNSRISAPNRKRAFKSLREAVSRLGKEDLISVVGVEGSLKFYSDFLYDRQAVGEILDRAEDLSFRTEVNEFERRQIFGELTRGQSGGIQARASQADDNLLLSRIRAYATDEYARSLGSLRQIETVVSTLAGVPGRKAVLYLGEGIPNRPGEGLFVEWRNRFGEGNSDAGIGLRRFDFGTDYERSVGRFDVTTSMEQLASAANSAEVTLYAIDAEGNHGGSVRSSLTEQGATSETVSVVDENFRAPLEFASTATGGKLLRSSGLLTEQLVDLLGDFDTFYSLGFMPSGDWTPGSTHDVKVRVKTGKLVVRHRKEVRLPEVDEREGSALMAALMYQTAENPLGIRAVPGSGAAPQDGLSTLPVTLEIPVGKLGFVPLEATHAGSLTIYVSTKDASGAASRIQKIPFHLNIPSDKIEAARGDTAHYPLPLVLRSGDQQVAIGIRDDVNGIFSAVRLDVSEFSSF